MTDHGMTTKSDPRIPVGTCVQFTQRPMATIARKFYAETADGPGTVTADDGSLEVPYTVLLDTPTASRGIPAATVLAEFNELEVLS